MFREWPLVSLWNRMLVFGFLPYFIITYCCKGLLSHQVVIGFITGKRYYFSCCQRASSLSSSSITSVIRLITVGYLSALQRLLFFVDAFEA